MTVDREPTEEQRKRVGYILKLVADTITTENAKSTVNIDDVVTALAIYTGYIDGYNRRIRNNADVEEAIAHGYKLGTEERERSERARKENSVMYV